jgi:hypothetical protein
MFNLLGVLKKLSKRQFEALTKYVDIYAPVMTPEALQYFRNYVSLAVDESEVEQGDLEKAKKYTAKKFEPGSASGLSLVQVLESLVDVCLNYDRSQPQEVHTKAISTSEKRQKNNSSSRTHEILAPQELKPFSLAVSKDEEEQEWEVKKITRHRSTKGKLRFTIEWADGSVTEEPIESLVDEGEDGTKVWNKKLEEYATAKHLGLA